MTEASTTLEETSASRSKRLGANVFGAFGVKGLALLVRIAALPAYFELFPNNELLGVWLVAVSMVIWFLTIDFGVGNGLRNDLVVSLGAGDTEQARRSIGGTYGASVVVASGVLALAAPFLIFVNWGSVFGMNSQAGDPSIGVIMWAIALTVLAQSVLRVVTFVIYALQLSAVNNVLALATSVLVLGYLYVGPTIVSTRDLVMLGVAYFTAMNLPLLVATVWLFRSKLVGCFPTSVSESIAGIPAALRSGRLFFVNQLMYTLWLTTTSFIVAALFGAKVVVDYQAHFAIFSVASTAIVLGLTPLWSAVTEAIVERDVEWVRRWFRRSTRWALVAVGAQFALALVLPTLLDLWLGEGEVATSRPIALGFALFSSGFMMHGVAATFASGIGELRTQALYYLFACGMKAVLVAVLAATSGDWILVPLLDGVLLFGYFAVESVGLRRWMAVS